MATAMRDASFYRSHGSNGWTIAEGVLLIVIGIVAIAAPLVTVEITAFILPLVLFVKGITEIVSAFRGRTIGREVWSLLLGAVSIIAAIVLFAIPVIALAALPVILIAYLLVDGVVRLVAAIDSRGVAGWGWVLFSGIVSIALGLLLWGVPFGQTLLLTGLYLGLSVLIAGLMLLAIGWGPRPTGAA